MATTRTKNGVTIYRNANYDKIKADITELNDNPDPDKVVPTFSADDLATMVKHQKANEGKQYLAKTDWYVARKTETGKAIPDDILTKREQARTDADFTG